MDKNNKFTDEEYINIMKLADKLMRKNMQTITVFTDEQKILQEPRALGLFLTRVATVSTVTLLVKLYTLAENTQNNDENMYAMIEELFQIIRDSFKNSLENLKKLITH